MSLHQLKSGVRLIDALLNLGKVLGYHVAAEHPVDDSTPGPVPAVDVAWFATSGQRFPLMIFEVESSATNAVPNNALKVYGPATERFEKPLFFFHIILQGGADSSRTENLERQYGSHNYRIYIVQRQGLDPLIRDILGQHRRIREGVNIVGFYEDLASDRWSPRPNPVVAIREALTLGLSREDHLVALCQLAQDHREVRPLLFDALRTLAAHGWSGQHFPGSFIGSLYSPFVLCAVMIGCESEQAGISLWDGRLLDWQNRTNALKQIGPYFGLSRDYDEFLVSLSGPLVALSVGVAQARGNFGMELCGVLCSVLAKLRPEVFGLQLAAWICHIAARLGATVYYDQARVYIDSVGGIDPHTLLGPPGETTEWPSEELSRVFQPGGHEPCVGMLEFQVRARANSASGAHVDRVTVALRALSDSEFHASWSSGILCCLWAN